MIKIIAFIEYSPWNKYYVKVLYIQPHLIYSHNSYEIGIVIIPIFYMEKPYGIKQLSNTPKFI